jgi:predicted RNA polymerase sigma factor
VPSRRHGRHGPSEAPANPDAWLLTAARATVETNTARRHQTQALSEEHLQLTAEELRAGVPDLAEEIPDRRLASCSPAYPAIEAGMRAPLIMQAIPR